MPGMTPPDSVAVQHWRFVLQPEGHDSHERADVSVRAHSERIDPPEHGQLPDPEVALFGGSAEHVVSARQLPVQHSRDVVDRGATAVLAEVLRLLELLEVHRVVHVGDEDLVRLDEPPRLLKQEALEDDDVGPVGVGPDVFAGGGMDLEPVMGDVLDAGRRHQSDRVLRRQRYGHFPRADRGPREPPGEGLPRHHEDACGR